MAWYLVKHMDNFAFFTSDVCMCMFCIPLHEDIPV